MLVTVLTVAYNAEKTIARSIESVLKQTYGEIEYIIIDGASKDKTVEVARSFQQAFNAADVTAILPWQDKLDDKVKLESLLEAIDRQAIPTTPSPCTRRR